MNGEGAIGKWLMFGLTAEQEERYRLANLRDDVAQARFCVWLSIVPVVALWFNDYAFNGLSRLFYELTALRLGLVMCAALLLRYLRHVKSPGAYDRAAALWGLAVAVFLSVVAATRPYAYLGHLVVAVIAVFIALVVLPNRFVMQVAVSAVVSVGEILAMPFRQASTEMVLLTVVGLSVVNAVGVAATWQLHLHRRREFRARDELEHALRFQQELLDRIPIPIFYKNEKRVYQGCNKSYEAFMGLERERIIGRTARDIAPGRLAGIYDEQDSKLLGETGVQVYESEVTVEGAAAPRRVVFHKATFRLPEGRVGGIIGALIDVTQQRDAEQQKERLISELREALASVKRLTGLLPICMYCHKIRDDNGYWNRVDEYIRTHSDAKLSHGLCPECLETHYPDLADDPA